MISVRRWTLGLAVVAFCIPAAQATAGPSNQFTEQVEIFSRVDANGDRRLSENEFVGEKGGKSRSKSRKEFRRLDDNGDGWVSYGEYNRNEKKTSLWPGR